MEPLQKRQRVRRHFLDHARDELHHLHGQFAVSRIGQKQRQRFDRALGLEGRDQGLLMDHHRATFRAKAAERLVLGQHLGRPLQPVAAHLATVFRQEHQHPDDGLGETALFHEHQRGGNFGQAAQLAFGLQRTARLVGAAKGARPGGAPHRMEHQFVVHVAGVAQEIDHVFCRLHPERFHREERVGGDGLVTVSFHLFRSRNDAVHRRIARGHQRPRQPVGVHRPAHLGAAFGNQRPDHRAQQRIVQLRLNLGGAGDRGKGTLISHGIVQRADIGKIAFGEADGELLVAVLHGHFLDGHLVKTRGKRLDGLQGRGNLGMFLPGDLRRHEYAKVPDLFMHHVDDALAPDADLVHIRIGLGNPVQRLLRRGDVVAVAGEDDDRRADRLQVDRAARLDPRLVLDQPVADEQLLDDPADFRLGHQEKAAPPLFEFKERLVALVDVTEQVGVLAEQRAAGVQILEVLHQMRAVEDAAAQIGQEHRNPGAAHHARRIAHRIFADLARPGGHGCAVDHHGAGQVGVGGRQQQCGPAALTVARDDGLRGVRMTPHHLAHEGGLGAGDIGQELPRLRLAAESNKVDRVTGGQRHAHLAVGLEAADARSVACARVDDDVGTAAVIDRDAFGRDDFQQCVVRRIVHILAVHDHFVIIDQHRRAACRLMFQKDVAALAQRVRRQDHAFPGIAQVFGIIRTDAPFGLCAAQTLHQGLGLFHRRFGAARMGFGDAGRLSLRGRRQDVGACGPRLDLGFRQRHALAHRGKQVVFGARNRVLCGRIEQVEDTGHG